MSNRKTRSQFILLIQKRIKSEYEGNKSMAAMAWGESPAVMYEVLGERRSPTAKILKAMKHHKITSVFYVSDEQ